MKKKILIGAFLLLVLITAIIFIVGAIESYNYDMDPANGVDILEGVGAAMLIIVGGLVTLCEIDLFFTVYYFLIKRILQTPSPLAMVLGSSSLQPKLSAMPRSPHIAWSHIIWISSSEQPCFCHAFTRGQ